MGACENKTPRWQSREPEPRPARAWRLAANRSSRDAARQGRQPSPGGGSKKAPVFSWAHHIQTLKEEEGDDSTCPRAPPNPIMDDDVSRRRLLVKEGAVASKRE